MKGDCPAIYYTFDILWLNGRGLAVNLLRPKNIGGDCASAWLLFEPKLVSGPHLAILNEFLLGYQETFTGHLIRFAYAFVFGFLMGYFVARVFNRLVEHNFIPLRPRPIEGRPITNSLNKTLFILSISIIVGLSLRLVFLGNTFESEDNIAVAVRVLDHPGYLWMMWEAYGVLINLWVKIFTGILSVLHIAINEFWWKAPIALIGTLQIPLTYLFLLRLGSGRTGALWGSATMTVLPLHVMHSRYLWGYEVLGVFFVTLAIWAVLNFFQSPSTKDGLTASLLAVCISYRIATFCHSFVLLWHWSSCSQKERNLRRVVISCAASSCSSPGGLADPAAVGSVVLCLSKARSG